MAIIKTLKTTTNDTEQSVYPKTVLEAVVDAETNETLDVILDNLNEKIDNIEVSGEGIDEVNTYLQRGGSKNLLKVTVMSGSTAGVTHTVNEDKSISTSGVGATNYESFTIGEAYFLKANTEYILSGCPKVENSSDHMMRVYYQGQTVATDNGDGVLFTVGSDGKYSIVMPIRKGVNYDNLTYYPMIREATVEDDTYEPYYQDAMTMVNHLNDNALVHGDVVDNLESTATDLPLSANQGHKLSQDMSGKLIYSTTLFISTSCTVYIRDRWTHGSIIPNGIIYGGITGGAMSASIIGGNVPSNCYFTPGYHIDLISNGPKIGIARPNSYKFISVQFSGSGVLTIMLNKPIDYYIGDNPTSSDAVWTQVN